MYKFDHSRKGYFGLDTVEGGYKIQIVENTDQGKFCGPLIVSSFSTTKGMFIRETNAKNVWSDSFLLAFPFAY